MPKSTIGPRDRRGPTLAQNALKKALTLYGPPPRPERDPVNATDNNPTGTKMATLNVQIWDATGNKRQSVTLPADAPVNRILVVLLDKMNFPQLGPDGQLLSYKFHHRNSGRQLLDEQTLADAGVKEGDILRLQPEITAGESLVLAGFRR